MDQFVTRDTRSPLERALSPRKECKRVDVEGAGGRLRGLALGLRSLTADEITRCAAKARAYLRAAGFRDEDFFSDDGRAYEQLATKAECLALALVSPDDHSPVAKDADEVRKFLEAEEIAQFYELWLDYMDERSPISKAKSWEELEGKLDAMGKGLLPPSWLTRCDAATLRSIVRGLVSRSTTATSTPSSPTSPPSEPGTISVSSSDYP